MNNSNYIVTAANAKFYKSFCQLAYSFNRVREFENSTIVFYDLGLEKEQAENIKNKNSSFFEHVTYRVFDFEKYPEFVKPNYMTWAWKPIIIEELIKETGGNIFWMDSANQILKNLKPLWRIIGEKGTYLPFAGSGQLTDWTMKATLEFVGVPSSEYKSRNRAGNTCAFSANNKHVQALVEEWKSLCLVKECVLPEGADRSNHRGDQSVLSSLLVSRSYAEKLNLTNDEVDISSGSPTSFISVRNRFPRYLPLNPGWLAFHYFNFFRFLDVIINKIKGN
ncbi:DUF1647 domain-containing protein [Ekhidna sp.]|jgi:hypothetical protein|uniref:DUF1647 domain-containing protein n=1 Tax=Ekhidna sp. TaxID=2608089 RepID=UPI0032EF08FD